MRWGLIAVLLGGCYASHSRDDGALPLDTPDCRSEASMVRIDLPEGSYLIDRTEVTQREYARFLRCAPAAPAPAPCGDIDHAPCEERFDPDASGNYPIECVTWCSAASYCSWAGKRLCEEREWMAVCESTRDRIAPGNVILDPRSCVLSGWADGDWGPPAGQPVAVGSAPECRGNTPPFDEVVDVIGNVEEMLAGCDRGSCTIVGNNFTSGPNQPCLIEGYLELDRPQRGVGFRCCANPR